MFSIKYIYEDGIRNICRFKFKCHNYTHNPDLSKKNIYLNVNVQLPVDIYIFGRFSYSLDYNALTQVIETIYI